MEPIEGQRMTFQEGPAAAPVPDAGGHPAHAYARAIVRGLELAMLVVLVAVLVIAAGELARRSTLTGLAEEAVSRLPLAATALRGELDKQRALPAILSEDPTVREALRGNAAATLLVDEKLRRLQLSTRAAVIYVIDRDGRTIAASNFEETTSFVGRNYRFRRYFEGALAQGSAEQVALGTVSGRPGVYIARRVGASAETAEGVVVLKVELDDLEADWKAGGAPIYVADSRGIVVATSVPDWRFKTLRELSGEEAAEIRDSLQFGTGPLEPLPLKADSAFPGLVVDAGGRQFVDASAPVVGGLPGWRLHLLLPTVAPVAAAQSLARLVAGLAVALVLAAAALVLRRLSRRRAERAEEARRAIELEAKVADRTRDLGAANDRLTAEIGERARAEARVLSLRDDLAQANRLATLGQITAGVAHEINQPLAAIRTYSENAGLFLDRGDVETARANLATVVGLTRRIAEITDTLRGFARRGDAVQAPVEIEAAVDGALLILGSRIHASPAQVVRRSGAGGAAVLASRVRLEQVLVNLVRNALDALGEAPGGRVEIATAADEDGVRLTIADNGPGISDSVRATLFTPFATTKPNGLGLGLVIAGDIVTELGGTLRLDAGRAEGAAFTIELPRGRAP
ncbi:MULTISPECIES: sensor histidine kinase [unclassified Aureimonas]|uniref:sensor histidine kinase n=1 Tax=unclassified Aureimonas TaxID=2615206 RepID=UPI00138F92DB|nr:MULTISPECIES: ATP-binding protein [unclassified Aureimonas]